MCQQRSSLDPKISNVPPLNSSEELRMVMAETRTIIFKVTGRISNDRDYCKVVTTCVGKGIILVKAGLTEKPGHVPGFSI